MGETRAGTPPFGDYVLSFSGKFLKDIRRDVSVRQAESFAVLGAEIDEVILDLTFHPVDISIKVEGKPCEPKSFLRGKTCLGVRHLFCRDTPGACRIWDL